MWEHDGNVRGREKQSFTSKSQITQQQQHHNAAHKFSQIFVKLLLFWVEISEFRTGAVVYGGAARPQPYAILCTYPEYRISGLSTDKQRAIKR